MFSGKVKFPNPDGTTTEMDNQQFDLTLKFSEVRYPYKKAPSRAQYVFVGDDGRQFTVMPSEFAAIEAQQPTKPLALGTVVKGLWEFVRRGDTYGLKLCGANAVKAFTAPTAPANPTVATFSSAQQKNKFQICIDRSASMAALKRNAVVDALNTMISTIKENAKASGQSTTITVWEFGGSVYRTYANMPAEKFQLFRPESYQPTGASTPLFQCLGEAIEHEAEDSDPNTSHFVYMITDGEENASNGRLNPKTVNGLIQKVQATDRWTFAIQMPHHAVDRFAHAYAIPAGNLQGWDVSETGIANASKSTSSGISSYFTSRAAGQKSVKNVYQISLATVKVDDVRAKCKAITGFKCWKVDREQEIKNFVEGHTKTTYVVGSAWYQLTKPETVQPYKGLMLRHKITKELFGGDAIKTFLGIDATDKKDFKVVPALLNEYDVFVTSTSVNRKLVRGTDVIVLPVTQAMPETWDSSQAKSAQSSVSK